VRAGTLLRAGVAGARLVIVAILRRPAHALAARAGVALRTHHAVLAGLGIVGVDARAVRTRIAGADVAIVAVQGCPATEPARADIVGGTAAVIVAGRAVRLGGIRAGSRGWIAAAGVVALVRRLADDRIAPDAPAALALIGLRADIIVGAGRAIGHRPAG